MGNHSRVNFQGTWNNYPPEWEDIFNNLYESGFFRCIIAGKEVGKEGTKHLQCHFDTFKRYTFKSLQTLIQKHGAQMWLGVFNNQTHCNMNRAYCFKDGDHHTWGSPPKQGRRTDLNDCMEHLKGDPECKRLDLYETFPSVCARYPRFIDEYKYMIGKSVIYNWSRDNPPNEWWYGPPGVGKSRPWRAINPYPKSSNKWWGGYDNEEIVLLEDLDTDHKVLGHYLKIWADRYPFIADIKGSHLYINPPRIVVTSNYHPTEIGFHDRVTEAIMSRFKVVRVTKEKPPDPPEKLPSAFYEK